MQKVKGRKPKNNSAQDPYSEECQKNARKSPLYSQIASSVTKCPFCDLKEKYIISQTEKAVLTVNLFPYIEGHLMVIPKKHIERLEEFSVEDWQDCRDLLSVGIAVLKKALQVQDVNILYREGSKDSGSSLKHLHIHILPIKKGFMVSDTDGVGYKYQDIKKAPIEVAEELRGVLGEMAEIEFMRQACLLCDNSTLEVKTGCLVVAGGSVVGMGWNCEDKHAEIVALEESQKQGILLKDATVYVTRFPCEDCAKELVKTGVSKLFYMSDHFTSGNSALPIFKEAGVLVTQILEEMVWGKITL